MRHSMIPLSIPNFEGNEIEYVLDAVTQGWVSTGGEYIKKLEVAVSEFVKVKKAVACQSGTSAIHLSLIEAGVENNDLVIVPTLTFIAAVNPVRYCGADPVFMDCDDSLCIDPEKIEEFIADECIFQNGKLIHKFSERRIKAIVVVHIFGNMANMEHIMDIANRYQLVVIEDATEALGTKYVSGKYEGMYAGTIGDFGAYSFNGNKIITTGGGGMVVAKNTDKLEHIRYLSTQAKNDADNYIHDEIGYNYRMTNVQAAIGMGQIEKLEEFIKRKNSNYYIYYNLLKNINGVRLLDFNKNISSNRWFYSLYFENERSNITYIVNQLKNNMIQVRKIWGLIHEQVPYKKCIAYRIEKASYYIERIINIPCSTSITRKEIEEVCQSIKYILEKHNEYIN